MPKHKILMLVIAVFILAGSCSYKEKNVFTVGNFPLYALSKESEQGFLSLSGPSALEYSFETPLEPGEDSSLEIEYRLIFPQGFSYQNFSAGGPVILDLGREAWELPVEFSFLGGLVSREMSLPTDGEIFIKYAVPLAGGESIEKISVYFNPSETEKKEDVPLFEIKNIALVKRWFGFAAGNFAEGSSPSFSLSPFVYVRDSSLVIDTPARFLGRNENAAFPRMELKLVSEGETLSLKTGGSIINSSVPVLNLPPEFISSESSFPLTVAGAEKIKEARLVPARNLSLNEPVPADPGMVLSWPRQAWRNPRYEFFSWENFPSILIFDFADFGVQDRFLKRLAFYVEKAGYRGRLMAYSEIAHLHGWNAHDYRASSLADFFQAAQNLNMPLLDEEQILKDILLSAGMIRMSKDESIIPGEGAVISISRQSPDYLRDTFLVHEGFHGLYFTNEDFRDFCRRRYETFSDTGKRFLISFFDYQYYDTTDPDLVVNEFMAYLLQQGVSRAGAYFGETRANEMIRISPWRRVFLPERAVISSSGNMYWPEIAETFSAEAAVFSRYVNQRWGFEAGRLKTVTVSR